jgi:hypothetical protein
MVSYAKVSTIAITITNAFANAYANAFANAFANAYANAYAYASDRIIAHASSSGFRDLLHSSAWCPCADPSVDDYGNTGRTVASWCTAIHTDSGADSGRWTFENVLTRRRNDLSDGVRARAFTRDGRTLESPALTRRRWFSSCRYRNSDQFWTRERSNLPEWCRRDASI